MKLFFTFLIFINSAFGFSQMAEFSILEPVFKFPKTKEGPVVEHTFVFTNTGTVPLIIEDYIVSCTCTEVFYSKEPIPPGGKGEIIVEFETKGKYYQQDRIVTLMVNTRKKTVKLRFKIYVIPKED